MTEFSENVVRVMKQVPKGFVVTYSQIASLAGNNRGARGVVYVLRSKSSSENLPWHRVINKSGFISIKDEQWFSIQKKLLENEGIKVSEKGQIDMKLYGWHC